MRDGAVKATAKRYRYTGMERDEETGLSYHTARYYLPWLGRWGSVDPAGLVDGVNVYLYSKNNPILYGDRVGKQCDPSIASCAEPELMSRWPYSAPVPNRSEVGHNVQRDHPIQISVRAEQRGRTGAEQRDISRERRELTILVETGRGRFHTELGRLQAEIRQRVRSGIITSESQLIEETRQAYELAGHRTGTTVNQAELDAVIISNLGVQSETFEQTRRELARSTGATTVTDESIDRAFSPTARMAISEDPNTSVIPNIPPVLPDTSVIPNIPTPQLPTHTGHTTPPPQLPTHTGHTTPPPQLPNTFVRGLSEESSPQASSATSTTTSSPTTGDYVALGVLGVATVALFLLPFDGPLGEGAAGAGFLAQAARMGLRLGF
jgi:RHS repeat-associated protein